MVRNGTRVECGERFEGRDLGGQRSSWRRRSVTSGRRATDQDLRTTHPPGCDPRRGDDPTSPAVLEVWLGPLYDLHVPGSEPHPLYYTDPVTTGAVVMDVVVCGV